MEQLAQSEPLKNRGLLGLAYLMDGEYLHCYIRTKRRPTQDYTKMSRCFDVPSPGGGTIHPEAENITKVPKAYWKPEAATVVLDLPDVGSNTEEEFEVQTLASEDGERRGKDAWGVEYTLYEPIPAKVKLAIYEAIIGGSAEQLREACAKIDSLPAKQNPMPIVVSRPGVEPREYCTPTHLCCHLGDLDKLRILCEHGFPLNVKDHLGRTPRDFASVLQHRSQSGPVLAFIDSLIDSSERENASLSNKSLASRSDRDYLAESFASNSSLWRTYSHPLTLCNHFQDEFDVYLHK